MGSEESFGEARVVHGVNASEKSTMTVTKYWLHCKGNPRSLPEATTGGRMNKMCRIGY